MSKSDAKGGDVSAGTGDQTEARFDVFLSHNSADKPVVGRIAEALRRARLQPWLDKWFLTPGGRWQEELATGLTSSSACAVFIGPADIGDWEREELAVAQNRAATDREFRLIPVLLPGVPEPFHPGALPPFLSTRTWVDFRRGYADPQALQTLINAVKGVALGPDVAVDEALDVCPYRGLQPFDEEDAEFFFGRDGDIQRLLEKLKRSRFLAVVGPSGSGKSSLVRAGLVPALRRGALPASERWTVLVATPGAHPLTMLASRLLRLHPQGTMQDTLKGLAADERTLHLGTSLALADREATDRVLLVVDQSEEVFTLCHDERERAAFLANLLYAASVPSGQTLVVLTLRADFYPKAAAYQEFSQQLAEHQYLVSPLDEQGLGRAIEEPARHVGLELEAGLIGTIVDDVKSEPGALPLLEHALLELWERRRGRLLTLEGYRESGGVEQAIALRAESIFATFSADEQAIARRMFLRLTQPGEGTEDTRRRATIGELAPHADESHALGHVLQVLVDARMLTTSGGDEGSEHWVDVSHEALIRGWPRLRTWVEADRAGLLIHRRVTEAAEEWQRLGRGEDALYRGARLAQAVEWRKRNEPALNDLEREFLTTGEAAEHNELEEERRRARWFRALAAGLGVLAVAAAVLAFFALASRREAVRQQGIANSRQLAAQADLTSQRDPLLAVLLSLAAYRTANTSEARAALLHQTELRHGVQHLFTADAAVESVAFASDGRSLAAGGADGRVLVWDVSSGKRRLVLPAPVDAFGDRESVDNVAFSPDGRMLASGYGASGETSAPGDRVLLWDVASGKRAVTIPVSAWGVQFSPDGKTLALGGNDKIVLWDVARQKRRTALTGHSGQNTNVAFSPDGRTLASVALDKPLTLWDIETGKPRVLSLRSGGFLPTLSFGPGGRTLAVGARDTVTLWDVATGAKRVTLGPRKIGFAPVVAFSPDGRTLSVGDLDGHVSLWDVASGKRRAEFTAHTQEVKSLAFSHNGRLLASGGEDGRVTVWKVAGGVAPIPVRHAAIETIAASPDGRLLALAELSSRWKGPDGRVALWDLATGTRRALLSTGGDEVEGLAFSPDGRSLATGGEHNRKVIIWSAATGKKRITLNVGCCHVEGLAFSPDHRTLAVANLEDGVTLWDYARRKRGRTLAAAPRSVAFSPDGRIVAAGGRTGPNDRPGVALWDTDTGKRRATLVTDREVWDIAFSPDGRTVVSADDAGNVTLWDVATATRRATLRGTRDPAVGVAFSRDGRTVAVRYSDGSVVLWDAVDRVLLGDVFTRKLVSAIAFTADGQYLAAGEGQAESQLDLEDVRASSWRRLLCRMVSRDFTALEWKQFAPHQKQEPGCT